MPCHALEPTVRTQIAGFTPPSHTGGTAQRCFPESLEMSHSQTCLQHSTCITQRPHPTSPSTLSHTGCTKQQGLDFPCLGDDHPALPYRVSTTPVLLWLFFSAHIPESPAIPTPIVHRKKSEPARTCRNLAGTFKRSSCWNRFFRPLNPFPTSKRRLRMVLANVHGGIRCRIVPPIFRR
jgi:hypothetical protein